jgi:hypothetical protein
MARLLEAVAAFRAALEELTRERVPLDWAMSTGNRGVALRVLAEGATISPWPNGRAPKLTAAFETCAMRIMSVPLFMRHQLTGAQALIQRLRNG